MKNKSDLAFKIFFFIILFLYIPLFLRITFVQNGIRIATKQVRVIPFNMVFECLRGKKTLKLLAVNYIGNVLLFIPIGLILPAVFKKLTIAKVVLISLIITVFVELFQNIFGMGYADIDDVIMNVFGALIGAVIFSAIKKIVISNVLTLILILALAAGGLFFANRNKPDFLPFVGNKIAGRSIDTPDIEVKSYHMSHGEVFIAGGSYYISDTAVFTVSNKETGKKRFIGIDEMIEKVENSGGTILRLWLDKNGKCSMILLEE